MVPDVEDLNASLLPHLALDGIFERLSGLDEAGHARPELGRPLFLCNIRPDCQSSIQDMAVSQRTLRPSKTLSPVWSITAMMTTASVRGCAKLCRPVAVGHGFLPALSAQGRREEHVSFQPAHEEKTEDPHDGQNCQ